MNQEIEKVFLAAYEQYADAIYRHCSFRVSSKDLAKDLTQDTFFKAWKYMSEGKQVENMRAFLYQIVKNLIVDEYRKKKTESLDKMLEEIPNFSPASDDHEVMEKQILTREVFETLGKLPEEEREILTMRYVDDLSPKEIAEVLNISANYVSVKINRATEILREIVINGQAK